MPVLLPASVRHNIEREKMTKAIDRQVASAASLCAALKGLDRRLDVVFISDRADPEYGVVPGRWHVKRENDGAPDTYIPITDKDGGYCEPHSGVYRDMQDRDTWKHGVPQHGTTKPDTANDEARVEELAHDLRAGARVAGDGGVTRRRWGRG